MPTDVQVSLQGSSGLPEDRYVNVLHFDGDDWGTGQLDELWAAYDSLITGGVIGGVDAGPHKIAAYAPGANPSGPYVQKEYTRAGEITNSAPTEVAICLSYSATDDPEASTPRRRGRIYIGPLTQAVVNSQRPGATLREQILDFGELIAQVGFANNVTWSLYSRVDASYHKIEAIWCDDAWDTQRRRGARPTLRDTRDVQ